MEIVATIRYERLKQIGVGQGMNSEVFLAQDPQLQGQFAVKEIGKANFGNDISLYFDEARTMFAVSHPNVVPIQYACQSLNQICLAMPYYASGSLADAIKTDPLPLETALKAADEVLRGVSRIHQQRYLHLDLKPTNVLFSDRGAAMVADFGQARQVGSNDRAANVCVVIPARNFAAENSDRTVRHLSTWFAPLSYGEW